MREIKMIGQKKKGSRNYLYSIFFCQCCLKEIEKIRKDGINANYCSHKCYAKNRIKRGSYKDSVIISGYRYIYKPEHPFRTNHNYVAEHRLICEIKLNRYLLKTEDVHHIDFDKLNNEPYNLMVLTKSEHQKLHKNKNYKPCQITE